MSKSVNGVPVPCSLPLRELLQRIRPPRAESWATITAIGNDPSPAALQSLCELLNDPDWRYRRSALEAMTNHPDVRSASDQIVAALLDASPFVVRTACEAASELKLEQARGQIVDLLRDKEAPTREAALRALLKLWQPSDFEPVLRLHVCDTVDSVQKAAGWALSANRSAETWRRLFEIWVDASLPRYRLWACELVRDFGGAQGSALLVPLMQDPDGHVRKCAKAAHSSRSSLA